MLCGVMFRLLKVMVFVGSVFRVSVVMVSRWEKWVEMSFIFLF